MRRLATITALMTLAAACDGPPEFTGTDAGDLRDVPAPELKPLAGILASRPDTEAAARGFDAEALIARADALRAGTGAGDAPVIEDDVRAAMAAALARRDAR